MKLLFPTIFFASLVASATAGSKSSKSYYKGKDGFKGSKSSKSSKSAKGPKCPKGSKGFGEKCGYYEDDLCCNELNPEDPNIVCEDLGEIFGRRCTDCLPTDAPCTDDRDCCNPGICFAGFCTEKCLDFRQPCGLDSIGPEACCDGLVCCELTNKCVTPQCFDIGEEGCCADEECCNDLTGCTSTGTCEPLPDPVLVRDDENSIGPDDHCFIEDNCIKSHEGFGSSNYNNSVSCLVNVTSGAGLLEFLSFETESCCDSLLAYDENGEIFQLRGTDVSSVNGTLVVKEGFRFQFRTDFSVTRAGFELCITNPLLED